MTSDQHSHEFSRRALLSGGGTLAVASGLAMAGCSQGAPAPTAKGNLKIPKQGADLPKTTAPFRWVDTGGVRVPYWKDFFIPAWQNTHPEIPFSYESLPPKQISQVVPLGIRNGTVQDVFVLPNTITAAEAVAQGWIHPLDEIIPHFSSWKSKFPKGLFLDGLNVFNGKTYSVPHRNREEIWHRALLQQAIDGQGRI